MQQGTDALLVAHLGSCHLSSAATRGVNRAMACAMLHCSRGVCVSDSSRLGYFFFPFFPFASTSFARACAPEPASPPKRLR